jgi:RNA polymerase subunit RPABC4/transcription elongation factor Spt4
MNSTHTACAYHSLKIGITKCTRCNRPICLEDKNIYEDIRRKGSRRKYVVNQDFCPVCYSIKLDEDLKPTFGDYYFYGFITIWIIITLIIFFPFALFGIYILYSTIKTKREDQEKAFQARIGLETFRNEIENDEVIKKNKKILDQNINNFTCFQCGSIIVASDKFCPNCGDSTKEELADR